MDVDLARDGGGGGVVGYVGGLSGEAEVQQEEGESHGCSSDRHGNGGKRAGACINLPVPRSCPL